MIDRIGSSGAQFQPPQVDRAADAAAAKSQNAKDPTQQTAAQTDTVELSAEARALASSSVQEAARTERAVRA